MKKSILKRLLQVALLSVLIVAVLAVSVSASENLTVHFLDVGQGARAHGYVPCKVCHPS